MATLTHALGTSVIWGEDGATGLSLSVTNTLSFNGLASTKARMGDYVDLGATWKRLYAVQLFVECDTAPAASTTAELWFARSVDGTNWHAGVTGSDGAWMDAQENEWKRQLGYMPALIMTATNDGSVVQASPPELWVPSARYIAPVVINLLGVALKTEGTASDNDSRVVLTPISEAMA
jgi:hypothetical protein